MAGLSASDKLKLLDLAREALVSAVRGQDVPKLDLNCLSDPMRQAGASFVTLTIHGNLRGCIGSLEARQPLAEDVREHAVEAALDDYRFPPVTPNELAEIRIEISHLTAPQPLEYSSPEELVRKLRPGIDGVVIRDKFRRATFLPQVWDKLPEPENFLSQLCLKMGGHRNTWRCNPLTVEIYQVEEFSEPEK